MEKESNHTRIFVGALISSLLVLPASAFARDGESSGTILPVNVSTHIEAEGDAGEASVNSSTTVRVGEEDKNNDSGNKRSDGTRSEETQQNDQHQSVGSGHESEDADSDIEIGHDSMTEENASSTIDAPENVTSHGELRSFLNHIVKGDDRIADVHVSSTTIETHYAMPAKFLWTIPVDLTANVSVKNDGSVTITYPWYAFLFATQGSDLAAQLEQSVTPAVGASASTTLSANTQAHLLNLLFSALKGSSEH